MCFFFYMLPLGQSLARSSSRPCDTQPHKARVVPPHAPHKATVDQGGHLAVFFSFFFRGLEFGNQGTPKAAFWLYANCSTFNKVLLWGGLLRSTGELCEWYYSDVPGSPCENTILSTRVVLPHALNMSTVDQGGLLWGDWVQHNCKAVERSGLGEGSVSSKKTIATGGHMETDAGLMR